MTHYDACFSRHFLQALQVRQVRTYLTVASLMWLWTQPKWSWSTAETMTPQTRM